jgi:glycosidase
MLRNVETLKDDPDSLLRHYQQLSAIRNNHAALRTGAYIPVETNQRRLFSMLRVSDKEAVLVLMNLGKEALPDPQISWEESPLSGSLKPLLLMGEGEFAALKLNEKGGAADYQPLPEVPPYTTYILQFRR